MHFCHISKEVWIILGSLPLYGKEWTESFGIFYILIHHFSSSSILVCVDIYTYLTEKYHVSSNVLSEKSTTMTSRRRFARHSACSTGRASRYIYYLLLSTIYREGHGFITVPDITHVLQTLGEKLAPDETQVQLLRRRRRCCYTSQPNWTALILMMCWARSGPRIMFISLGTHQGGWPRWRWKH